MFFLALGILLFLLQFFFGIRLKHISLTHLIKISVHSSLLLPSNHLSHFPLTGFHQISSFLLGRAIQEFKKQGETFILRRLPENGVWHLRLLRKKGADSRSIPTYLRIRQRSLRSRTSRRFVGKAGKKGRKEGEEGRGGRKKGRKASLSLPSFSLFFFVNFRLTLIRTLIRTSDWRKLICLRRMNSLTS